MKLLKKYILPAFILITLCSFTKDYTTLFYQHGGKEIRLQRWYLDITGHPRSLQFIDSRDTNVHMENGATVQIYYIFEEDDDRFLYFQKYSSRYISPTYTTYTPLGEWAKVTKDWTLYIDSTGKSHNLYKK